jgi:hypothetical protein
LALSEALDRALAGQALSWLGTALLVWGLVLYAKAKGRSGWWGLLGLLSLVGLIGLAVLEDRGPPEGWARDTAIRAGAPSITREQVLGRPEPITVTRVDNQVVVQQSGRNAASFPAHAEGFLRKLAVMPQFSGAIAATWEPLYTYDDVSALLGTLVRAEVVTLV